MKEITKESGIIFILISQICSELHDREGQKQGSSPTITRIGTNCTKRESLFLHPSPSQESRISETLQRNGDIITNARIY
jgi:hypothetical protein